MKHRHIDRAGVLMLSVMLVASGVPAQQSERPGVKDFGSSLKKIKSSQQRNDPAESKPKPNAKSDDEDIEVVKVETNLVTSDLLVLDAKGAPVYGLTDKDFLITEDGRPQQVSMLAGGNDLNVGRSIVLIMDYSGSQLPFIKTSVEAAKALVDKLAPADNMAIVTDDVDLIQDFTQDKKLLKSKLDSLQRRVSKDLVGKSKQYSALLATLNEVFSSQDRRPIVIFQTDGDELQFLRDSPLQIDFPKPVQADKLQMGLWQKQTEERRKVFASMQVDFTIADIYRAAEKARATIYTVLPGERLLGRTPDEQMDIIRLYFTRSFRYGQPPPAEQLALIREYLKQNFASDEVSADVAQRLEKAITDDTLKAFLMNMKRQAALTAVSLSTGGWTSFLIDPGQADRIYANIFSDINQRYLVGYYPTNKEHDGKRRKFEVTVRDHPDYAVLGRRWYLAPAPD